jgi:hypothetical protein
MENGMLSANPQTPQMPPDAGMLDSGAPAPVDKDQAKRFNGTVQSDQGPIEVVNGIAVVDKMAYFVSDDGSIVADKDGNLIAVIVDGKVVEPTPEIIDQLKQEGKVN